MVNYRYWYQELVKGVVKIAQSKAIGKEEQERIQRISNEEVLTTSIDFVVPETRLTIDGKLIY